MFAMNLDWVCVWSTSFPVTLGGLQCIAGLISIVYWYTSIHLFEAWNSDNTTNSLLRLQFHQTGYGKMSLTSALTRTCSKTCLSSFCYGIYTCYAIYTIYRNEVFLEKLDYKWVINDQRLYMVSMFDNMASSDHFWMHTSYNRSKLTSLWNCTHAALCVAWWWLHLTPTYSRLGPLWHGTRLWGHVC